jgi:eukaryotic-like serine/threonine-protein kinase
MDPLEPVNSVAPAIPMHISKAIERAMSLHAQHRFSSVEEFWEALWLILAEQPSPVFDTQSVPKGPLAVPTPGPESIEEQEDLDVEQPLPKSPAGVKEQEGQDVVHLLPKPSGGVRAPISLKRMGEFFIVLALLISLGIGTSFLSRARSHISAQSATLASHIASPASTPTSDSVASSYSTLAGIYTGTIYDISVNITTKMSLTGIQQTQITIGGNFTGLHRTGTFNGIIDPHPPIHIQFTVKDSAGHIILSFDGHMQSDGEISGSFCNVDQNAQCTGEYGLWSVAPAS